MAAADTNAVRIWLARAPEDADSVAAASRLASREERAEAAGRTGGVRDAWLLRRAFRRQMLAHELGVPPGDVDFVPGPAGKPGLRIAGQPTDWEFSASWSRGLVGLALVRGFPLGLDVECRVELPDIPRLAGEFPEPICNRLRNASEAEFFAHWVAWEAVAKAIGCGLGSGLGRFVPSLPCFGGSSGDVSQAANPSASECEIRFRDADTGRDWWVTALDVPGGFAGALAAPCPLPFEIRTVVWPQGELPQVRV